MASFHIFKLYKCNKYQEFREYDLSVIMTLLCLKQHSLPE